MADDGYLTAAGFRKVKIAEIITAGDEKRCRRFWNMFAARTAKYEKITVGPRG